MMPRRKISVMRENKAKKHNSSSIIRPSLFLLVRTVSTSKKKAAHWAAFDTLKERDRYQKKRALWASSRKYPGTTPGTRTPTTAMKRQRAMAGVTVIQSNSSSGFFMYMYTMTRR